ncbi:hypothetical protein HB364_31695 [Pseudoflavitalea sp. X16]|uniref:hypothetical protein n=1 Tax=Paraflavitalea devenefica TaxID=2716334 RepID=UPI001423DDAD|nr:hypothetical protein [Paraflavitalea devenefica]NII29684.1 hypothetical protein [Paraflavitalea devenefica]
MQSLVFKLVVVAWLCASLNKDVYVCKDPGYKHYYKEKSCRGLDNCSTRIYQVTVKYATDWRAGGAIDFDASHN